jgi:hypothetical protein
VSCELAYHALCWFFVPVLLVKLGLKYLAAADSGGLLGSLATPLLPHNHATGAVLLYQRLHRSTLYYWDAGGQGATSYIKGNR